METEAVTVRVEDVKAVVVATLEVEDRAAQIHAQTALLDALPELDSLAVLELVLELERRFGITVEDEDVTTDAFATLASLTELVARRAAAAPY